MLNSAIMEKTTKASVVVLMKTRGISGRLIKRVKVYLKKKQNTLKKCIVNASISLKIEDN